MGSECNFVIVLILILSNYSHSILIGSFTLSYLAKIIDNVFSSRDISMLPERVLSNLKERERSNEVLVRIIQLGIVVLFITLYSVSAKTGEDAAFQPVPYVLGIYCVLSIIGLIWSIRSELPSFAVYFSIIIDFTILYSLIISFHYQYEQPPAFILNAPTLLYVFIFIALRALRLEWKYVAAAGFAAAIGWAFVILYVTIINPQEMVITRDYVEYLTTNSILIGAEIDKIISVLLVSAILALVVNGSSNLLVTAVSEQMAAQDFSRFFDESVAQDIRSSQEVLQAGTGERRNTAIINIDIRGFSKLAANREPSEVMQLLSAYQGRLVPILQSHGAIIDKFMGDGIMATIGIDNPEMPFSRNAMEAAEAILKDWKKWKKEEPLFAGVGQIKIGIGIACGTVAFGAVGQGNRLEMTVIGAPVNTSAKLEKHNKVLGTNCITTRRTWDSAVEEGYKGDLKAKFLETDVEGMTELQNVAILKLSGIRK